MYRGIYISRFQFFSVGFIPLSTELYDQHNWLQPEDLARNLKLQHSHQFSLFSTMENSFVAHFSQIFHKLQPDRIGTFGKGEKIMNFLFGCVCVYVCTCVYMLFVAFVHSRHRRTTERERWWCGLSCSYSEHTCAMNYIDWMRTHTCTITKWQLHKHRQEAFIFLILSSNGKKNALTNAHTHRYSLYDSMFIFNFCCWIW